MTDIHILHLLFCILEVLNGVKNEPKLLKIDNSKTAPKGRPLISPMMKPHDKNKFAWLVKGQNDIVMCK